MTALELGLPLLLVVLLALWWFGWRKARAGKGSAREERIDTLIGWPPQATRVLTNAERVAFSTLTRALPEYMILAQVPLSRFVNVPKRQSYADWLRRVGHQCVDFVICDMNAQVVAVVEVQSTAVQSNDRSKRRLQRVARTLTAAHIPLHVWTENALPASESARELIAPKPAPVVPASPAAPAANVEAGSPAVPPPPFNPFEDTGRDWAQDEVIEPPPSTWFDDLDTAPAPLKKH